MSEEASPKKPEEEASPKKIVTRSSGRNMIYKMAGQTDQSKQKPFFSGDIFDNKERAHVCAVAVITADL